MKLLAIDITLKHKNDKDIITLIGADGLNTNLIMQFDADIPYKNLAKELKLYIDLDEYEKFIISKEGIGIALATELEKILDKNKLIVVGYEPPLDRQESILNLIDTGILEQLDIDLKLAIHKLNDKACVKLDDEYYSSRRKSVGIISALKLINDFYINNK